MSVQLIDDAVGSGSLCFSQFWKRLQETPSHWRQIGSLHLRNVSARALFRAARDEIRGPAPSRLRSSGSELEEHSCAGGRRESIKWRATFEVLKLTEGSAFSQLFLSRSRWPAFEGSDKHWWSRTLCSCRKRSSTCGTDRATTQPLEKLGVGAPGRTRTCDLLLRSCMETG